MSFPPIPGVASIPFPFSWSFPPSLSCPFKNCVVNCPSGGVSGVVVLSLICSFLFDPQSWAWCPLGASLCFHDMSWSLPIFCPVSKSFAPSPDLTLTFSVFALFPRHFRSLSTSFSQSWSYECCGTDLQACGREWRAENLGCPDESYTWWHGQTGRNVCHLSAAWSLGSCLSWIRSLNCSAMRFSHEKIAKRLHWLHMELFCCTPHDTSWLRSLQTSRSVSHTGPCMDLASTLSM